VRSASATPTAAPPSVLPSLTSYVVQSGDTITGIANKVGVDPTDLADFNNIANWNSIRVGDILYIPGPGWTPLPTQEVADATNEAVPTPVPVDLAITVEPGWCLGHPCPLLTLIVIVTGTVPSDAVEPGCQCAQFPNAHVQVEWVGPNPDLPFGTPAFDTGEFEVGTADSGVSYRQTISIGYQPPQFPGYSETIPDFRVTVTADAPGFVEVDTSNNSVLVHGFTYVVPSPFPCPTGTFCSS